LLYTYLPSYTLVHPAQGSEQIPRLMSILTITHHGFATAIPNAVNTECIATIGDDLFG
jgi:hypothetical protein